MNLAVKIHNFIKERKLLKKGELVLIGVSGGADSVCLTNLLYELKYEMGINLALAHYNHNLRKNSGLDQKFVGKLAAKLDLPCYVGKWLSGKPSHGSIEDWARTQRFKFLIDTAKKIKADCIALAHNKNDVAETILMRILRGSGLFGLRAIMPRRKLFGFDFIRPLLEAERKEIESYLKKRRIRYREDETNRQAKFFRNKIRLDLIPHIRAHFKKDIVEILYRLSQSVADDYDFLDEKTQAIFEKQKSAKQRITFSLKGFKKHHPALKRLLIRSAYKKLCGNTRKLTLKHINEALKLADELPAGSIVSLPHRVKIKKEKNSFVVFK